MDKDGCSPTARASNTRIVLRVLLNGRERNIPGTKDALAGFFGAMGNHNGMNCFVATAKAPSLLPAKSIMSESEIP